MYSTTIYQLEILLATMHPTELLSPSFEILTTSQPSLQLTNSSCTETEDGMVKRLQRTLSVLDKVHAVL